MKPGNYWCRIKQDDGWYIIERDDNKWVVGTIDVQSDVLEVGPYIPTPDEMKDMITIPRAVYETLYAGKCK